MATIPLPPDFKEFLLFLNSHQVDYLLIGGWAVAYHGYPRATGDMDIWVAISLENAERLVRVLGDFGFGPNTGTNVALFLEPGKVIRMGNPPLRIEILTNISGVDFEACYSRRIVAELDGLLIPIIALTDLRANKLASGRTKDRADLENLPEKSE